MFDPYKLYDREEDIPRLYDIEILETSGFHSENSWKPMIRYRAVMPPGGIKSKLIDRF